MNYTVSLNGYIWPIYKFGILNASLHFAYHVKQMFSSIKNVNQFSRMYKLWRSHVRTYHYFPPLTFAILCSAQHTFSDWRYVWPLSEYVSSPSCHSHTNMIYLWHNINRSDWGCMHSYGEQKIKDRKTQKDSMYVCLYSWDTRNTLRVRTEHITVCACAGDAAYFHDEDNSMVLEGLCSLIDLFLNPELFTI